MRWLEKMLADDSRYVTQIEWLRNNEASGVYMLVEGPQ